jgi:hypothetical protein
LRKDGRQSKITRAKISNPGARNECHADDLINRWEGRQELAGEVGGRDKYEESRRFE